MSRLPSVSPAFAAPYGHRMRAEDVVRRVLNRVQHLENHGRTPALVVLGLEAWQVMGQEVRYPHDKPLPAATLNGNTYICGMRAIRSPDVPVEHVGVFAE